MKFLNALQTRSERTGLIRSRSRSVGGDEISKKPRARTAVVSTVALLATVLVIGASGVLTQGGSKARATDTRPAAAATPAPPPIARATRAGGQGTGLAVWAFRPETLRDLSDHSDWIVVARVLDVEQGPALESPADPNAPDEPGIPTQRIRFLVERTIGAPSDSSPVHFTLFRTGGRSDPSEEPLSLEGDPPYHTGEEYLLFLSPGPGETKIPSAPDGRLFLSGGRLRPLIEGPVGHALAGKTPDEVEEEVR